jgi:hypothetical protein
LEQKKKQHIVNERSLVMSARKTEALLQLPEPVPVFRTKHEPLAGPRQPAREKRGIIAWADVDGIPVMVWRQGGLWWVIDEDPVARQAVLSLQPQLLTTAEGDIGSGDEPL